MANFKLTWTPNITSNVTAQRAYYKRKNVGSSYTTTGFAPPNDLPTTAVSTTISGLLDNIIYQFKVANICTDGGPTFYVDVLERINFSCALTATTTPDIDSVEITQLIDTSVQDINSLQFTIVGVGSQTITPVVDGANTVTFSGLDASTDYIVHIRYGAIVNGVQTYDTGNTCILNFTTGTPVSCPAPSNLAIT